MPCLAPWRIADMPDYAGRLAALLRPGGLLADLKGMWRDLRLPDRIRRWVL